MGMLKFFDKIKASFSFKSGNKNIQKNSGGGDNSPITTNTYNNANYIKLLEEKLDDVGGGGIGYKDI